MSIGMNFHSPTLDNPEGLRKLDLRWALFLAGPEEVWNDTTHLWGWVLSLCPRCEPVVRFYRPNVMAESPEVRARQFCDILTEHFGDQPIDALMGNEPDQAIEHGGKGYRFDEDSPWLTWSSPRPLRHIADWLSRYADAHRALRPQDILHLPACSAGMDRYTYWAAMPLDKFAVLDEHWYDLSNTPDPGIDRPWAVTEWGKIGGTPEEYAAFARSLGDTMNCIWKWSEPQRESNPEGDPVGYAIADRPDVIAVLAKYAEANVDNSEPDNTEVVDTANTTEDKTFEEEKSMDQQHYLDILADIDTTAEELQAKRLPFASRVIKAKRIQDQCRILDDLKVEGGSAPAPLSTGQQIVAEGRKWTGKLTYCWDGKDPAKGCLDCSGYLDVVWKAVTGKPVAGGGGTWWMLDKAKEIGEPIGGPPFEAGYIVFWDADKDTDSPSHVGIATGEGTVLECSLRYNGVTETPWEPEWAERFHSAWRIL